MSDAADPPSRADPHLAHLQRFPVKSLDPEAPASVELGAGGALVGDREWAIVDGPADEPHDPDDASLSAYVNGKKTDAVHRLRTSVDLAAATLSVRRAGDPPEETRQFDLDDPAALNDWLSGYFEREVSVRSADDLGFPDRRDASGPTVVSTATLRAVGSWFDLDLGEARRRFRANVEIGGVPAFWEDRLFADEGEVVAFRVGGATFEGIAPCGRCVVPSRDSATGEAQERFREEFVRRREATSPAWTESDRFDNAYSLAVTTRAPDTERGTVISVGDAVEVAGTRPA